MPVFSSPKMSHVVNLGSHGCLAVVLIAPDNYIPVVQEDLALGPNQNLWVLVLRTIDTTVEIDIVGTIGYDAEVVKLKDFVAVVTPPCR